jgi:toxin-antitoxin system PIN domain toxin
MKHLLDVNCLLAAIWSNHPQHARIFAWLPNNEIALCPIAELGFLRISSNKKAMNVPMEKARELLAKFAIERAATRINDDLPALDSHPKVSGQVTDHYLADLADKHRFKLATLDEEIAHTAVEIIPKLP